MSVAADTPRFLRPDWSAPARVHAHMSLRGGGVSAGSYASLNLGAHVGDAAEAVAENRRRLHATLHLPAEPLWLQQVHGVHVIDADQYMGEQPPQADAAITRSPGRVLAVLVADCLPVLFARRDASAVAVAHAGWRGLAGGVLEATVAALGGTDELLAWLGPAISPANFEVGAEVRTQFCDHDVAACSAFARNARGRWQCDLYALARLRLRRAGLHVVDGAVRCTLAHCEQWFSHRRDGVSGRMAALIWLS